MDNQTVWAAATVSGDAPTPARIRVQNPAGNTDTTMADVRIAARSRGTVANFQYPHRLGVNTATGAGYEVAYNGPGSRLAKLTFDLITGSTAGLTSNPEIELVYSSATGTTVTYRLPGVMSRKKQVAPKLMAAAVR